MGQILVHVDTGTAGLGNRLFPWARAEIFRHTHGGLEMLAPQWVRLKIGPLLRREKDLRYYTDLFTSRGYVRGIRRWWWLAIALRIPESEAKTALNDNARLLGRRLIVFRGMEGHYDPLAGHEEFLHRRLLEMLTKPNLQAVNQAPAPWIAIHVRRGDVKLVEQGQSWEPSMGWLGLPEGWYVRAVKQIRESAGWEVPVTIFTDAYENQIPQILSLPGVNLFPKNPAIVDMLAMAKARVLLPTTSSTFSMWSAFLGQMPIVFYPGKRLLQSSEAQKNIDTNTDGEIDQRARPILQSILAQSPGSENQS
jgi:hypothetical protein